MKDEGKRWKERGNYEEERRENKGKYEGEKEGKRKV